MHRITRPRLIVPTLLVALALLLGAPLPHDARAQSPDGPAVPAYSNRDAAVTILGPPSVDTSFAEINFGGSSELPAQILIIPGIGVVYGDPLASGGAIGGGMLSLLRLAEPFDFNAAAALQPAQISTASLGGALHTADHFDGWPEPPTTANSSDARPEDAPAGRGETPSAPIPRSPTPTATASRRSGTARPAASTRTPSSSRRSSQRSFSPPSWSPAPTPMRAWTGSLSVLSPTPASP